jgi:hypothetical protein
MGVEGVREPTEQPLDGHDPLDPGALDAQRHRRVAAVRRAAGDARATSASRTVGSTLSGGVRHRAGPGAFLAGLTLTRPVARRPS